MDISKLLPDSHCIVQIDPDSRQSVLTQLMQPLIDSGIISNGKTFLEDLEQREAQITTVIGNGVALPHARSKTASRLGLSVGILHSGKELQYSDSQETEPVQLLFMIAIPAFAPASHLPLLQHITKFVRHEKKIAKLLKSKTSAAAAKYLHSFKAK
ncbi:MAG: PTS sugar transporter subunit IIA [Lentisphaeraceae bacterium]|nr:PTS sugar transporter subunit IIA [Lentisphaeraceae bacterium]